MKAQQLNIENSQKQYGIQREYKDQLLRLIFQEKEDLLDLYNAVNGTAYTNPDDLEYYTIDNAIYISVKNDISFLIGDTMNLYEHQSTVNPNMPIRGLIYLVRNFEAYIQLNKLDIYSTVLQKLPLPQFIVFYNGTKELPDKQYLDLEDAFIKVDGKKPCLNCQALVLNVNYEYNKELLKKCRKLEEYALFVSKLRSKVKTEKSLRDAVDSTIDECINEKVLEKLLVKHRGEVREMVLSTFDQENHDRILKEAYFEIGKSEGERKHLIMLVCKKLRKGYTPEQISEILEEDIVLVNEICEVARNFEPEYDEEKVFEKMVGENIDLY